MYKCLFFTYKCILTNTKNKKRTKVHFVATLKDRHGPIFQKHTRFLVQYMFQSLSTSR